MWQMKAENNKLVEKHTECKCFHTGLEGMLWWEWKMMRVTCSSVTNPTEHLWGDFGAPCQTDSVLHPSKHWMREYLLEECCSSLRRSSTHLRIDREKQLEGKPLCCDWVLNLVFKFVTFTGSPHHYWSVQSTLTRTYTTAQKFGPLRNVIFLLMWWMTIV